MSPRILKNLSSIIFSCLKMFFTSYVRCGLRLLQLIKLQGINQTLNNPAQVNSLYTVNFSHLHYNVIQHG